MIREEFGNQKAVFANQDDGIFSAIPITLDSSVYTLETETVDGRTYAKAGSVVKEGTVVRGILPEAYDITDGPTPARVALEGYAYASRLTVEAVAAAASLPKIVLMPYKAAIVSIEAAESGLKAKITVEGTKFATTAAAANFTVTGGTIAAENGVKVSDDQNSVELTFTAAGEITITAIANAAFTGTPSGITLKGLPLTAVVVA